MMKYIVLLVELLLLSSCNYIESENESNITKRMKIHIFNNVDGSYDFFECNMVKEHIDSLCWRTDIYRIQQQIYMYAKERRAILSNSYVPVQVVDWSTPNNFDSDFTEPQGYGKQIRESYITKEEREICDYFYYSSSVSHIRKIIKQLETEKFHGDRIYYACRYRIAIGAIVYKQYVLYKEDNKDDFTICGLEYNYDMLRNFIQSTLNVNMEDSQIKDLITKYELEEKIEEVNSTLGISNPIILDKYGAVLRRFKIIDF